MFSKIVIKYILIFSIVIILIKFKNSLINKIKFEHDNNITITKQNNYSISINGNMSNIYLNIENITYYYSQIYKLIEIKYYFKLTDENNVLIHPSNVSLVYNLHVLCTLYIFEDNETIYSIANIFDNKFYFCVEFINITEQAKFGIKIYNIDEINEEIEYIQHFFFTDKIININLNPIFQNNNKFDVNYISNNYIKLIHKINLLKKTNTTFYETFQLKFSYIKPPLSYKKRDISRIEGKWYYNNLYENYFCFCRGESCINIKIFNNYIFQYCKYYFYLTILDNNRNLYIKSHYLLSDFFDKNIEPADAFPIFKEMINENLNAHYLTMSTDIFNEFCSKSNNCYNNLIIYGIKRIDGDILEKYLELLLKLKAVIAAEKYDGIDNLFYNVEYITYIFIGHGVQFVKSFLYNDYRSYKNYNKILLPESKIFIDPALEAGWKIENLIRLSLPRWDNYTIFKKNKFYSTNQKAKERSIFLMFTWRKIKINKNISELYYNNLNNLFNDTNINEQFQKNHIKLYYCYHHKLKEKRKIKTNKNIIHINQNDISSLLKNSSLIITDFSSILFDAIVQKKPLILYIPDGLDSNLKDIYSKEYYETITKLKQGKLFLYELYFDLKNVINKIIYYIKNDFILENEKLKFYNKFKLNNSNNTKKFISYLKNIK